MQFPGQSGNTSNEVISMDPNLVNGAEIPMGLGMALAKDFGAMQHFSSLPAEQRQAIISQTHQVHSKEEMEELVRQMMRGQASAEG